MAALGWLILADRFQRTNAQRQDLLGFLLLLVAAVGALSRRPRPTTFALTVLPLVELEVVIVFLRPARRAAKSRQPHSQVSGYGGAAPRATMRT